MRQQKVKIYSRYNTPVIPGLICTQKSRTQQHFKNETDINQIIKRAIATGNHEVFTTSQRAQFYDCTIYKDYQSSLDTLGDIEDDFYSLPSSVRKEFGNNVDKYVAFMADPRNVNKAVELGLLEGVKTEEPPVSTVEMSNPPGGPAEPVLPGSDA